MKEMKPTVTQEKREETIEKILEVVANGFDGVEVTCLFTKVLLEEAIRTLEERAMLTPLNRVNKS